MRIAFYFLLVSTAIWSNSLSAAPKLLTCTELNIDDDKVFTFTYESILETEDFEKESPQHEATLVSVEGETPEVATEFCETVKCPIGETLRLPFTATASTLTLVWRKYGAFSSLGQKAMDYTKLDISRKDLSHPKGTCSIEDYGADNAI